jgi:hypothetical protein
MPKVFALTAFLSFSFAAAVSNISPPNLAPIKSLCFNPDDIHLQINQTVLTRNATRDIFQFVNNKLTEYGIPHKSCTSSHHKLYIQIDASNYGSDLLVYSFSMDVFDVLPSYKAEVSIYSRNDLGVSPSSMNIFLNNVKDSMLYSLDHFGTDFRGRYYQ